MPRKTNTAEIRLADQASSAAENGSTDLQQLPQQTLLWSIEDLARELRLGVRTVRRFDLAGKIPRAVKVGRLARWVREEITAWAAAGCPDRRTWEAIKALDERDAERPHNCRR